MGDIGIGRWIDINKRIGKWDCILETIRIYWQTYRTMELIVAMMLKSDAVAAMQAWSPFNWQFQFLYNYGEDECEGEISMHSKESYWEWEIPKEGEKGEASLLWGCAVSGVSHLNDDAGQPVLDSRVEIWTRLTIELWERKWVLGWASR